jgi:hypothetical protein
MKIAFFLKFPEFPTVEKYFHQNPRISFLQISNILWNSTNSWIPRIPGIPGICRLSHNLEKKILELKEKICQNS